MRAPEADDGAHGPRVDDAPPLPARLQQVDLAVGRGCRRSARDEEYVWPANADRAAEGCFSCTRPEHLKGKTAADKVSDR